MALGFFNLGPQTHMSGQIGVPSIWGGSQNLDDPSPNKFFLLLLWERVTAKLLLPSFIVFFLFENIS